MPEQTSENEPLRDAMFGSEHERHKFNLGLGVGGLAITGALGGEVLGSNMHDVLKAVGVVATLALGVGSGVLTFVSSRGLRNEQSRQQG